MKPLNLIVLAAMGIAAAPVFAQESPWEVQLLPYEENWTFSAAWSLNEAGDVCGNYSTDDIGQHAVLWRDGTWFDVETVFGMPDGYETSLTEDMNNTGILAGQVAKGTWGTPDWVMSAVLWDTVLGTVELIHPAQLGYPHSEVTALNDSGLVAIELYDGFEAGDVSRCYLLDRNTGTGRLLPLAPGLASNFAAAINESGVAAGWANTDLYGADSHAIVWPADGSIIDLHEDIRALVPAVAWSRAFHIDQQGRVCGTATTANFGEAWPWVWSAEDGIVIMDRGPLANTYCSAINEHMIVGFAGGFEDSVGVVWIDGIYHEVPSIPDVDSVFMNMANSSGVFIGDIRSPEFRNAAYIGYPTESGDFDNDGLLDKWELQGYVHDNEAEVDLPGMGSNPLRRDLFVEIDSMVGGGFDHRPTAATLKPVVDAFAARGIALHINLDESLPFDAELGTLDDLDRYQWAEFDALKAAHFAPELESAVRYCVFAHRLATLTDSGAARGEPSSDFIVSLGAFVEESGSNDAWMQAGTFMHELGHTLGLRHGGADVDNQKPNYLSVMNYDFQKQGLRIGGQDGNFDYSCCKLPDLNESALDEGAGLGTSPLIAGAQTLYRALRFNTETLKFEFVPTWSGDVTQPIDWNDSKTIDAGTVPADINGDGSIGVLVGHDDWSALDFKGGTVGFGVGLPPPPPPPETVVAEELTVEIAKEIPPPSVEGIAGRAGRGSVRVSWTAVGPFGQGQYKVYRWSSTQTRADAELVKETEASLISDRVGRGTWNYVVTVTDTVGAESLDSNVLTLRVR